MKPQSYSNYSKELLQNQRMCLRCGKDTGYDDSNKVRSKGVFSKLESRFVQYKIYRRYLV